MQVDVETAVIGGGVIGLAIAAALSESSREVLVLERNDGIGQETSSRSSEVIHAGIYYPKGSLKARLCVEGKERLYRFAMQNGVDTHRTGKLIVATSDAEVAKLHGILAAAQANGVADLKVLSAADASALESEVNCVAALLSPSTGIVDSHGLMLVFEGHLSSRGGSVVLQTRVEGIDLLMDGTFALRTISGGEESTITARYLIGAAGHGMAHLRDVLPRSPAYLPPQCHLAKGHYFTLRGRTPFRHLIYPVPVDGGLGTHLTLDLQGRARFGPDVNWCEQIEYAFHDPDGTLKADFETSIRRYWPGLPDGAIEQGYTGIRPKITPKGEPAGDFVIHGPRNHGIANMVVLYGIESPGLTSSLAIADYVTAMLKNG